MDDRESRPGQPKQRWLLVRGFSREQRHWGSFPDTFATALGVEVTCLDAPGFGDQFRRRSPRSAAGIAEDIRDRLGPIRGDADDAEWSILGISLGGIVAQAWCARHPDDFARCVLVNTAGGALSARYQRTRLSTARSLAATRWRVPEARERGLLAVSSNRTDSGLDDLARRYAGWLSECPPHPASLIGQSLAAVTFRAPRRLPIPTLVLASTADRLLSYRCSEQLARRYDAPLRLHDTAGHDLPLDDPDWVSDQVRAWWRGARPTDSKAVSR